MGMVKMKHVSIYGTGNEARPALIMLTKLECFHPDSAPDISEAANKLQDNAFTPLLLQTVGVLKDIGADHSLLPHDNMQYTISDVKKTVNAYSDEVAKRRGRKAEIEAKLATFEQTKSQLYHLTNLHTNVDEIFACKYLKVRFGRLPKDSYAKLPYYAQKPFTFNDYDFDGEYYWGMYFVPESHAGEVDAILTSLYFERLWVPDFVHGTPQDALVKLIAEQTDLEKELKEISDMSDVAMWTDIIELRKIAYWLNYEAQIFDMKKYVTLLEHSYYVSGYVPEDDMPKLVKELEKQDGIELIEDVSKAEDEKNKEAPVKLKNSWFVSPFETFVEMYGLPSYGDLDPSGFVAVTFSIVFGAMFGDIGQGLVLGLIGYFVMYKKMHMDMGLILARASVFSIFFGFIYGSLFGFEHIMEVFYHEVLGFTLLPIVVMEPNNINSILVVSIAVGIFIICAAMLTGIIANVKKSQVPQAVFHANGVAGLVFYVSLIGVVANMALGLNLPFVGSVPFYVLFIGIPFVSMYFAEPLCELAVRKRPHESFGEMMLNGFFEIFHVLLAFASNTMSFLRVGGFVLVHAGMASVVHTLAAMTDATFAQVLIYIAGNIFIIAIEGLFVTIQVLRLEFYEVFSRFFEADGLQFSPLKISKQQVDQ